MRALILSCNTGEGHNSCAAALREYFTAQGTPCQVEDALGFLSEGISRFISNWHTRIYRYLPFLFRSGYRYTENHPALLQERSRVYRLLTSGTKQLYEALERGQYDTVICTHVFSAMMMQALLEEHPGAWKTAFVATDYTCSPHGSMGGLDWYFIPDMSLAEEFVRSGIPGDRLIGSGIPVRPGFLRHIPKTEAKQTIGMSTEQKHLMVMCGSMGCGPLQKVVDRLAGTLPADAMATVICGTNTRLFNTMTKRYATAERIHILGYTNQIPLLMDSADFYLTKPGGISVTEAATKGLPMAFIDAVAGCEAYNMRYFIQRGGAVTADTPEGLADVCTQMLTDDASRQEMARCLRALEIGGAAEQIYCTLAEDGER